MPRPTFRSLGAALWALAFLGSAPNSQASLCAEVTYEKGQDPREWSWSQRLERARAAFVGEVLFEQPESAIEARYFFLVEKAWKGEDPVAIAFGPRAQTVCGGIALAAGQRVLVFLTADSQGRLQVTRDLLWKLDLPQALAALEADAGPAVRSEKLTAKLRTQARRNVLATVKKESPCAEGAAEHSETFPIAEAWSLPLLFALQPATGSLTWDLYPGRVLDQKSAWITLENKGPCWVEMEMKGAVVGFTVLLEPWKPNRQRLWGFDIDPEAVAKGRIFFTWHESPVPDR